MPRLSLVSTHLHQPSPSHRPKLRHGLATSAARLLRACARVLAFPPCRPPKPSLSIAPYRYATTIHVLNSAVVKLSKLTQVTKVYRGIATGALPDCFFRTSALGVRGGVENSFMSTSTKRSVALTYASGGGGGILLEIEQGMCSRGACLNWLSQYPHEEEVSQSSTVLAGSLASLPPPTRMLAMQTSVPPWGSSRSPTRPSPGPRMGTGSAI